MITLAITLPLPDRALCGNGKLPNTRGGHIARNKTIATHRAAARLLGQQHAHTFPASATIRVATLVRRDPRWSARRLDADNLIKGLKPYMDGLADAGVYPNDRLLQWGDVTWEAAPPGQGEIVLTLTQEEA